MKINYLLLLGSLIVLHTGCSEKKKEEWIELFNGKDLSGWKASENQGSFNVQNGMIVASGKRSHLFYAGEIENAEFRNFEISLDVMTTNLANSGIYFHTKYQEEGWPEAGYEIQINNSHIGEGDYRELKKTGSLYGIRNSYKTYVKDSVWFNVHFIVQNKHVFVEVDGRKIVDYTEAANPSLPKLHNRKDSLMTPGTFGLQCHDPESKVFYKNIKIKILTDDTIKSKGSNFAINDSYAKMMEIQVNQFPFIDLHISTNDQFDIKSAVDFFYRTGINLGLVIDLRKTNADSADQTAAGHAKKYSDYPVFLGIIKDNETNLEAISPENLSKYDYVMGEVAVKNTAIINKETFMNDYVTDIISFLNRGDIDIWATPTQLPAAISSDYDKLWTKERMSKVIDAARAKGIAIEIHNTLKVPGIEFIKLAKEKGCLFTCGGIDQSEEMGRADYFLEVIQQCGFNYKDIFVPGTTMRQEISEQALSATGKLK